MKKRVDNDQTPAVGIQDMELKMDKYRDKAIRFYKKQDHYDLIFGSDFQGIDQTTPIYADLLLDLKDADKNKEVHVWIHSCGGDCSTLMLISQQLDQFEYVVTIGLGEIDSAGFMLWSKGDERYLSPTTFCMYHGLSTGQSGKANEMKEYSLFIQRYQDIFQMCVKDILTQEELSKGRYTELWFLGKELIERGKAIDYKYYKERKTLREIQAYSIDNDIYIKRQVGTYIQVNSDGLQFTRKELMKKYVVDCKKNEQIEKMREQIGQDYIQFFMKLLEMRGNSILQDGFISYDYIMESWQGFGDQKITQTKLVKKLQKWVKQFTVNLKLEKDVEKSERKGIVIKIVEQEQKKDEKKDSQGDKRPEKER